MNKVPTLMGAIGGALAASAIFLLVGSAAPTVETSTVCLSRGSTLADGGQLVAADVSGRLSSDAGIRWVRANGAWPVGNCELELFTHADALLEASTK